MTPTRARHPIRITAPYYQSGAQAGLHRYLDADFVNRFRQDVLRARFDEPQFSAWQEEERHSRQGREPVLRLPLHRAFHLLTCEVVCERLGHPALDPLRVTSAGFVIRRIGGAREQTWMIEDGEAIGWQDAPTELRDPDLSRRVCADGVVHTRNGQPSYSGEEIHPLHVLAQRDTNGRSHTLLFGYVPLGGSHYLRAPLTAFDAESERDVQRKAEDSLPWPFGFRESRRMPWREQDAHPLERGRPTPALFELLRLLTHRYHVGARDLPANAALSLLCSRLWLFDEDALPPGLRHQPYTDASQPLFEPYRRTDLFAYLQACFAHALDNPLVRWIAEQEKAISNAGGLGRLEAFEPLPAADRGELALSMFLREEDARELRNALGQRLREQTLAQALEIPMPKFGQEADDVYRIVPLVRALNDQGREQLQWADETGRSIPFRVAAPFDPDASRPSVIQMPSLADLKRGLAKGAALITPSDTFDLLNQLKLDQGAGPDALPEGEPGPGLGLQWICSFSLPVITLVAMILLMIMISLLNILFFWLPWVRICLPFPKINR